MQEQNISITSASLIGDMFCTFKFKQEVSKGIFDEITVKSNVPVHEDMKAAFQKLNAHLAVICEQVAPAEITDIDDLPLFSHKEGEENSPLTTKLHKFSVSSFHLSGSGENEGVHLNGTMRLDKLKPGDSVSLSSPKVKYEDTTYNFVHDLRIHINTLIEEVDEYRNGKRAPIVVQTEMSFEEEETK